MVQMRVLGCEPKALKLVLEAAAGVGKLELISPLVMYFERTLRQGLAVGRTCIVGVFAVVSADGACGLCLLFPSSKSAKVARQ